MSVSVPSPDRCHDTWSPLHIVRPGRFLYTYPLMAVTQTQRWKRKKCSRYVKYSPLKKKKKAKHFLFSSCLRLHTVHSVAFHEALVLLVDGGGRSGVCPDVVVQIPAQVLIKHCGQQMEFFGIVSLCGRVETKQRKRLRKCFFLSLQRG